MTHPNSDRRAGTLARIRALMAKTKENGCTEAEAAEAARKVDELMALYEIDMDEVSMRQQEIIEVTLSNVGQHSVFQVSAAIGRFCDCKAWKYPDGRLIYFGFQVDTEIAEYLTLLFKRAIDRESAAFTLFNHAWDEASRAGQEAMLRSFGIGMAVRLSERLADLKSKRDFTQRSNGNALVLMKMPAVEEAFDKLGIHLQFAKPSKAQLNKTAYAAGQDAARHVAINQGISDRVRRQGGRIV